MTLYAQVQQPGEHLKPGGLHVVPTAPRACRVEVPEVDGVADGGHNGVEDEAEEQHHQELPHTLLK